MKIGAKVIENIGYIIDDNETRVYITSDTICFQNEYKCDILCVPVSDYGVVMGAFEASLFAKETNAKLVIPLHADSPKYPVNFDFVKEMFDKNEVEYEILENNESIINSIETKEIHMLNCYFRFMSLCDMMKRFEEYDNLYKQIIKYKKRAFYKLKVGDIVYIKVHRNIGEKCYGLVIRREFDEWLSSIVINVEIEKEKIQVEYEKKWFVLDDYPDIITTTKKMIYYLIK